jgi:hypothetical protein
LKVIFKGKDVNTEEQELMALVYNSEFRVTKARLKYINDTIGKIHTNTYQVDVECKSSDVDNLSGLLLQLHFLDKRLWKYESDRTTPKDFLYIYEYLRESAILKARLENIKYYYDKDITVALSKADYTTRTGFFEGLLRYNRFAHDEMRTKGVFFSY